MLFNSLVFVVFAAVFYALWPLARARDTPRWAFITAASFVFYGWWDWRYVLLLVFTGLVDWLAALGMQAWPARRKLLLVASLGTNLATLAIFKYLGFLAANANALFAALGSPTNFDVPVLTLPIGISFYTFQSMSYTIDVYRRQLAPTRHALHFFASLSLFPHLVAGPIMRASSLLPQLQGWRPTTEEMRWTGLKLVAYGYFKKMVIADNLAPTVNAAFGSPVLVESSAYWWVIVVMFAAQIYCDFSGYSDIARGLARWMGYEFMVNFDHPYTAASVREFWARWHISLSTWFRDYLYIPLGGSRRGTWHGLRNLWITMLLSGLWHGAAWTFVTWGALHALYLTVERLTDWPDRLGRLRGGRVLAWTIVLLQVLLAWVFFRAESFAQAIRILGLMIDLRGLAVPVATIALVVLVLGAVIETGRFFRPQGMASSSRVLALEPVHLGIVLAAVIYLRGPGSAFIYFQF